MKAQKSQEAHNAKESDDAKEANNSLCKQVVPSEIRMCILSSEYQQLTSIADDCNNSIPKHTEQQQLKPSTHIAKELKGSLKMM